MKKRFLTMLAIVLTTCFVNGQQTNFSGTWKNLELEMVSGIQYSNAVPTKIKITQTKDSIKLERTDVGSDGEVTSTETLSLNGKASTRVTKTSKRTISSTATWSNNGNTLTLVSIYSYAEKPKEAEYTNTEVWELSSDGMLTITKTSDAAVTDDWTIKAFYSKG